jgi:uncharacterized membrane protein
MSELVVIGYKGKFAAEEVRLQLRKMQREYLTDVKDAVVAVKERNGCITLQQVHSPAAAGAPSDSFWRLLVGALFLSLRLGTVTDALSGALAEVGIDDTFMKALADTLQPSSSALLVLVRQARPKKEMEELKSTGGKLLMTSLRNEKAERLEAALDAIPPPSSLGNEARTERRLARVA